jgi:hypothetical protein
MKRAILMVMFLALLEVWGSGLLLPWSAKSAASGNSGFICRDSGGFIGCPAFGSEGVGITATYLYNMEELPRNILVIGTRLGKVNLGYGIEHLHHPLYKETSQLVNAGFYHKNITTGINLRNLLLKISDESLKSAVVLDLGLSWQRGDFETAFSWLNITGGKLSGDRLPVYLIWESGWKLIEEGELCLRLEKETGFNFSPVLAAIYTLRENLSLITSYGYNPENLGIGFEIARGKITISYGMQYNRDLEESHYITVLYAKSRE